MADNKKLDYIQERVDTVVDRVHDLTSMVERNTTRFADHISQDERMYDELAKMTNILKDNTDSLKDHMHRTDLLEKYCKSLDDRFSPLEMERIRNLAVKTWVTKQLKFAAKIGGAASAIAAILLIAQRMIALLG